MPRKWHNYLRSIIGELIFRRAIKRCIQNPELCLDPDNGLLHDLVYGWGNSWSAQHEYLAACLEAALQSEGPILECGSGLSTVLLGAIADCKGYKLYSFENSSHIFFIRKCCSTIIFCVQSNYIFGIVIPYFF